MVAELRSWLERLISTSAKAGVTALDGGEEQPLRAELFSIEQLARHAGRLAGEHRLAISGWASDHLMRRLDENERVLLQTYNLVTAALGRTARISPAATWLLDNFYLIEDQIRLTRRNLPRAYSRELPRLSGGPQGGYPRAYVLALELIAHVDGRVDADSLNAFVAAYQTSHPLLLGELWAIPIMLGLALVENLRRVAARVAVSRRDRDLADDWAERMLRVVEHNPTDLVLVLADMARANPPLSGAFLAELTRHLQGQSPHFTFANSWLEHRLSEQGQSIERLVLADAQVQAADQISMGNSVTSLRFLGANDWRDFVEMHSRVERTLGEDPAGVYARMDFASRDDYRHRIEEIAKRSACSEVDVADQAVTLARQAARAGVAGAGAAGRGEPSLEPAASAGEPRPAQASPPPSVSPSESLSARRSHVGYYLVDAGRPALERAVKARRSLRAGLARWGRRMALPAYLLGAAAVALTATMILIDATQLWNAGVAFWLALAVPAVVCASHLGVAAANWLATLLVSARRLPRLDFSAGIPGDSRTLVAVPTLLSSADGVQDLLEGLEVRYLANRDDRLHFALLTDFTDAKTETADADADLLRAASAGVAALNRKYQGHRPGIFFLFHRPRRFNRREGVWMGHERKRGKLAALSAFLRRPTRDDFSAIVGDTQELIDVRYVITLDTDTQLPRDAAREMVGAMAHILNRPVLNARASRVVDGYAILQPRVSVSLPSAQRSWFVRLFAGDPGVDPYTRVVSDVYQDLFGEGSFIGKGIYDVDAFERTCGDFPTDAILSHDLLEGAHARSGLLSDVELYEEYPSRYLVDVSRRHRWIRGDWQISPWLLPRVPRLGGGWGRNPITAVSWWKIFDNLRRSLVPIATVWLLLSSWLLLPPAAWALVALFVVVAQGGVPLLGLALDLLRKPTDLPLPTHAGAWARALGTQLARLIVGLVFIPYEAYVSFDAIVRTLGRMLLTRRRLLEWTTARDATRGARTRLVHILAAMSVAPLLCIEMMSFLVLDRPAAVIPAAVFLVPWFLSPALGWWLSRELAPTPPRLSRRQRRFLRALSRKTWRFFEVFVSAEENWLPPDNIQDHAGLAVASRTSPTNIGIALLANLSAVDFGYCTVAALLDRTRNTVVTLGRMGRYRGHFFNWYDTRSLKPLQPQYVSTVDSGNLSGHLLIFRSGLRELCDSSALPPRILEGLRDTAWALADVANVTRRADDLGAEGGGREPLTQRIERFEEQLRHPSHRMSAVFALLSRLSVEAEAIVATAAAASVGLGADVTWWAAALVRSVQTHQQDLLHLAPWVGLAALPGDGPRLVTAETRAHLQRLDALVAQLEGGPSPRQIAAFPVTVIPALDDIVGGLRDARGAGPDEAAVIEATLDWCARLRETLGLAAAHAAERVAALHEVATACEDLAEADYSFLFDRSRDLFAIGYNVDEGRLDASFYDLLASEARLVSLVAISQGKVGQEHWFALGRMLTRTGGAPALLSWSGSMFEYLMPLLVMPTYENTLLDRTYKAVVQRQIDYGNQRAVPWGISESGYNTVDLHMNYQYRAFGVPGLGLKRGLAEDLVIAPYATALALMIDPEAACRNLERLTADGFEGSYGLYEAIDYTPSRVPRGASHAVVRQFMAHHQGMSLLSLAYLLLDRPMQRRFEADPMLRADCLLLQERVPKAVAPLFPHVSEADATGTTGVQDEGTTRVFTDPAGPAPEVNLLSNGRYHVVVTHAGGGYSRWRDFQISRWREDSTRDCWGSFCYLRDLESGARWSTAWQPTLTHTPRYQAIFTQARAEFRRRDDRIETHTEISVSPEDDVELRRTTLTNRSDGPRTIEVTTYTEVVLCPQGQDLAHPAFSNLFVQTELVRPRQAIICTRRPRSAGERPPWMVHLMTIQGHTVGEASFETDRMRFIGRGRTLAFPAALDGRTPLSDSAGPVLDPVACVRRVILLQPNESARVDVVTGVGESREVVAAMMDKYHDAHLADRVPELAWTHSRILLRQINATEADAELYSRLAGSVIYASDLHRARSNVLMRNRRSQSGLWGYAISGDLPIVLVRISDPAKIELCRQAIQAHAYWRMKGMVVDLVIWNEDNSVYRQTLQEAITDLIAAGTEASLLDKPGGILVRRGENISEEDRVLLQTVARVVLQDDAGTFAEQVDRRGRGEVSVPLLKTQRRRVEPAAGPKAASRDLAFFNGLGGFSRDGREYVISLAPGQATPAPWVNVIANPYFGTVVSESGSAYTWAENSHEYRLTPWTNDPVSDVGGEAVYVRDEQTGYFWSPCPFPARGGQPYVARHGFGYSMFEGVEDGIVTELSVFVAIDAPVKFTRLRITNRSGRPRRLSVTGYWDWVLGDLRDKTLLHVVTELDPQTGALFARNAYSSEFSGRVAFADASETARTVTGDRAEFLGRNGTLSNPAALRRARLSGLVGAGLDPCAAIQIQVDLADGQEREVVFTLGAATDERQARQLVQRFRGASRAYTALEGVWHYWSRTLGAAYCETPDPAVNFLANGWLIYQVLAARMWGRTGFYQSGGAFGFRDQLQDAMAVVHAEPGLLREQVLRAAGRQFREGDVQHWWHPPAGRGVRTHFSDDYLWLPYATCRYVTATGDTGVLDQQLPFLSGRPVRPEEESYYDLPQVSDDVGTLYEHCRRAIERGLRFGVHGLPLMGCGDWNDGMNLVGAGGKGESVWLAFFLFDVLTQFAPVAERRGDGATADRYRAEAARVREHIEATAWDGDWYRRAYFDDGEPLGSVLNAECKIDALPQCWSILSSAGKLDTGGVSPRAAAAMNSVDVHLVRRDARLVQVLEPPFDQSALNPGYIKGYVPGVRENGGQYTHAAVWTAMAFAQMGDRKRAWELFQLINPVLHANTPAGVARYRVEPYVVAADVYAVPPHTGRGGWTWYTGSAGWMYRLITESLLGLHLEVEMTDPARQGSARLRFAPCLPAHWTTFKVHYRYRETLYHITVKNGGRGTTVSRVIVDGQPQMDLNLWLFDDRGDHQVSIEVV